MGETILIIPGYDNSGLEHWQTYWENSLPNAIRVVQQDWLNPIRVKWIAALNKTIQAVEGAKILVAHSLGCIAVVEWANQYANDVKGMLLVAPPDLEAIVKSDTPSVIDTSLVQLAKQWLPVPNRKLPYPSILVASSTDQYTTIINSQKLAKNWGCKFVDIGAAGHINDISGHNQWEEGKKFILEFK